MFSAKDAVKLGLADSVMTRTEFNGYLSGKLKPKPLASKPSTTNAELTPLDRRSKIKARNFSPVATELILSSTKSMSEEKFDEYLNKINP